MSGFFDYFLRLLKTIFIITDGSLQGKLDLQKSFYFSRELGLQVPFKFRWGKLGPYSYELSNVMNRVSAQGFVPYRGGYEYNESRFRDIRELDVSPPVYVFFDDLQDTVEETEFDRISFIEGTASLHFLRKYSGMPDKESTFEKIYELKEDRMDFLAPLLNEAWEFLLRHDLIEETYPSGV